MFQPRLALLIAPLLLSACGTHYNDAREVDPSQVAPAPAPNVAVRAKLATPQPLGGAMPMSVRAPVQEASRDRYADLEANPVQLVSDAPVSTFSIDVDTGAYTNVRRFLNDGELPPQDAVRSEELINYFHYAYPHPKEGAEHPLDIRSAVAPTPWNPDTLLLRVSVSAVLPETPRPPANLVFLLDTSGSMHGPDRLPLLKKGLRMLTRQLRADDRVAIVTYAGSSGLALKATPGDHSGDILAAIDGLEAGGSTAGASGITLAYEVAAQNYIQGGINRVLLGTDGDFNVGLTDTDALIDMVSQQRKRGIALTTLGFGRGNLNEAMMEQLADKGDGQYAYIDNAAEANRLLAQQVDATLFTVARDVKIQVEFNPGQVREYRLIGYENRLLAREDFNNDAVDAGEVGAGHQVTALYELVPVGSKGGFTDPLRYQPEANQPHGNELAFLRLRYKRPGEEQSRLLEQVVPVDAILPAAKMDDDLRFAAAVAAFAENLRGGKYVHAFGYPEVKRLAQGARGEDPNGERGAFLGLIDLAAGLTPAAPPTRSGE